MVLGQDTSTDHISVIARLARVDVDHVQNTRGTRLDRDTTRLVELVGEDVLIVGEGDDELHDELPMASHDSAASPPVGMLPANAVVLFVQADGVGQLLGLAVCTGDDGIEVLNDTQAVAANGQVIGHVTTATIAEIESLLTMVWGSWIGVWDRLLLLVLSLVSARSWLTHHLTNSQPVHDTAAIVPDIVNRRTLTRVEGDTEPPLLPFNKRFVGDLE